MKFLVDANVLSEPTRPRPQPRVVAWLRENESELAVNPVILGELEYGILLLPAGRRRTQLQHWFADVADRVRILDVDVKTASEWARLLAEMRGKGLAMPVKDSLIAASALAHRLIVATRNTRDFQNAAVRLVNPFED